MPRILPSAPASAGAATGAAAVLACLIAGSADAGVVSVIGSQASAQFSNSGGPLAQDTFLISSLLTEFYYAESFGGTGYGAFAMDVEASSIKVTFDVVGAPDFTFLPGVSMQVTFAPTFNIDSFTVGLVDGGVSGLDNADLSRLANVVTIDLSGISVANPGDSFVLNFSASAVPGPASLAALAGLAAARRRRR
ncbi:MAG: hypothetical protein ACKOEL_03235 [Planctomycetota bacterium]